MATQPSYESQEIFVGGGSYNIDLTLPTQQYFFYTTTSFTLLADFDILPVGTPTIQQSLEILFDCSMVLGEANVTIDGNPITQDFLTSGSGLLYIKAFWDGSVWQTVNIPNLGVAGKPINGTLIKQLSLGSGGNDPYAAGSIAVTKLTVATRGMILRANASGIWGTLAAQTSGQLLIGDGTDIKSTPMSGDVTINGSGVTAIGAGKVTPAMLSFTPMTYYEANLTLSSANILALNGTPQTIVAAPGAGYSILVISARALMTFVSAAYATNTVLQIINTGADIAQLENSSILISTVSKRTKFVQPSAEPTAGQTQIISNTGLQLKVKTGAPTLGDSTCKVSVIYAIIAD